MSHGKTWGKAFQAEDVAHAKVLRQGCASMSKGQHRAQRGWAVSACSE